MADPRHLPVVPAEVLAHAAPQPGETWVDCTVGVGGHTRLLAHAVGPTGRVIGLDQDAAMLALAQPRVADLPVTLVHANFDDLPAHLARLNLTTVDGVLADLGFCSDQMTDPRRGFSFLYDGPLDMRLDPSLPTTAADLVANLSERELADLIYRFGEERHSRKIAKRIAEVRRTEPLRTTRALAELVRRCVPGGERIDPATRVFQALRIAVNEELDMLDRLLRALPGVIRVGGRAAIISFHSLEDRPVKYAFRDDPRWEPLTRKPIEAGPEETQRNPRARSAKLRVARRLPG
jgi:16S rRNA (cytosine1402-N4)-methyltransferase